MIVMSLKFTIKLWPCGLRLEYGLDTLSEHFFGTLCLMFLILESTIGRLLLSSVIVAFTLNALPTVSASPLNQELFPDITFGVFSEFIIENFTGNISLVTVLTMLFTLTRNPEVLNLHARQQKPTLKYERKQVLSGWMKALTRALKDKIGQESDLFSSRENDEVTGKLISLSKLLKLNPYDKYGYSTNGKLRRKLQPVARIEPALVVATNFMECQTVGCNFRGLLLTSRKRDVSHTTLIEGATIHKNVTVLIGECTSCYTLYHADHEHGRKKVEDAMVPTGDIYLNSAKYLKIGANMWADRVFTGAILNAFYSFHASTAAFMDFWNESFDSSKSTADLLTRRQIWQGFVQESI